MSRLTRALVLAGSLPVLASVACNSVLGIDEAHSRDIGVGAPQALEVPIDSCNGPQPAACGVCIGGSCKNTLDKCLASYDCRQALNEYRKCLGSKCDNSDCTAALQASPAHDLTVCAQGGTECPECPEVTPLVDICQLYCSCMEQPMPSTAGPDAVGKTCEQYDGSTLKDWTAGSMEGCLTACRSLKDPAATHCRWSHCELAQNSELALHCTHAIGDQRCPLAVQLNANCKDRRINNWGCDKPSQCCSDHCLNNICVP